jgi:hypothetical protein
VEETDVWGTLTERDSKIYEENDVEVFIAGRDAYYEFEINARNVVYEVFWIWKDILKPGSPYYGRPEFDPSAQRTMVLDGVGGHVHERGERWGFLDWDFPGLKTAVHVDGVLNSRTNTDRGWTVELAFPWKGLTDLADGRALPPRDGDIWRIDCSRFEKIGRNREVLDPCVGWTWNRHGHYDSHIPEVFPYVTFVREGVRSEERECGPPSRFRSCCFASAIRSKLGQFAQAHIENKLVRGLFWANCPKPGRYAFSLLTPHSFFTLLGLPSFPHPPFAR